MTRRTNARIAGVTFLVYIAAGITSLIIAGRASGTEGIAAMLGLGRFGHRSPDLSGQL